MYKDSYKAIIIKENPENNFKNPQIEELLNNISFQIHNF